MKNSMLENLELNGLTSISAEEYAAISGGYSWDEFKKDCSAAWDSFTKGFESGFATGVKHADQ